MERIARSVEALWLAENSYFEGSRMVEHSHESYYQIYYVTSGSGTFLIDRSDVRFKSGMFFLCAPGVSHGLRQVDSKGEDIVRFVEIKFVVFDSELDSLLKELPATNIGTEELQTAFYQIFLESVQKHFFYEQRVPCMLEAWLYRMVRDRLKPGKSRERVSQLSLRAKQYIDAHYNEDISLDGIAAAVGCSKSSLCQVFRRDTGRTINTYLSDVRITYAINFLLDPSLSIAEVGTKCGYKSLAYFSKAFKNVMGVSPASYRRAELAGHRYVVGNVATVNTVMHNSEVVVLVDGSEK